MRKPARRSATSGSGKAKRSLLYAVWAVVGLAVIGLAVIILTDAFNPVPEPVVTTSSADGVQRIAVAEAKARLDADTALLLDARSRLIYDTSHAAGAVHLSETDLDAQIAGLPRDKDLVLYCT
jgi:hypothetical protein